MKISITESRKEVNKNTGGVKLVMMLLVANLMALNPVFAQENTAENDPDFLVLEHPYFGEKPV
jgi:hypothetical protein